jgi:putative transposase
MTTKFQNKYRIESARLHNWDYRSDGSYFITICSKNKEHFFGEIQNNEMNLTEIGQLANQFWKEIPEHFPCIELGNFVIMPNHVHGILTIHGYNKNIIWDGNKPLSSISSFVETLQCKVSTNDDAKSKNEKMSKISPKPGSISTIIRSYKSVVSKHSKQFDSNFAWQSRFHDHIIRNRHSFYVIQKYISQNPMNWDNDRFNK